MNKSRCIIINNMQEIKTIIYSCFEKTFNKGFCKTLTEINVLLTYFCPTNVSNAYNIILKHSADVSVHAISINANILIIYSNNIIIIHSDYK